MSKYGCVLLQCAYVTVSDNAAGHALALALERQGDSVSKMLTATIVACMLPCSLS
jgi:hypothetical protein